MASRICLKASVALLVWAVLLPRFASAQITNIYEFLQTCPMNDPAIDQILSDFKIRTNGIIITNFPCQEPISSMSESNVTVGLYVLQALRAMYYMDRGMVGHLPWTHGALYDWMKSQIKGIDVRSDSGFNYCCETYPDGRYIVTPTDGASLSYLTTNWAIIAGKIAVFGHEARHVVGFSHSSCCGIANGCDYIFDTNNLSPYGIQWWLFKAWLFGEINVGLACGPPDQVQNFTNGSLNFCNNGYRPRFCTNPPPLLSAPPNPGGPCLRPVISPDGSTLMVESCSPPNGAIDPGETVTLNFSLKNTGDADTSNLVATLSAEGGVILPSGSQNYGALTAGGPDVVRPFTFSATGACVGTLTATFQLQDGEVNLGTVAFAFPRDGVACSQTCSPRVIGVQLVGADVQISFVTVAGRSYRIDQADSLLAPVVWTGVSGASGIAGTGGIVQGTDIGAAGQGGRFYRVVLLP